jgi:hypothetical protein
VYVGTVVGEDSTSHEENRYYTVAVEHSIGGAAGETQLIATGLWDGTCGIRLEVGARYLLLPDTEPAAMERMSGPSIGLCSFPRRVIRDATFISQVLALTAVESDGWGQVKTRGAAGRGECSCSWPPAASGGD